MFLQLKLHGQKHRATQLSHLQKEGFPWPWSSQCTVTVLMLIADETHLLLFI